MRKLGCHLSELTDWLTTPNSKDHLLYEGFPSFKHLLVSSSICSYSFLVLPILQKFSQCFIITFCLFKAFYFCFYNFSVTVAIQQHIGFVFLSRWMKGGDHAIFLCILWEIIFLGISCELLSWTIFSGMFVQQIALEDVVSHPTEGIYVFSDQDNEHISFGVKVEQIFQQLPLKDGVF